MRVLLYSLLIVTVGLFLGHTDDQMFETETVLVGEDVTLKCDLGSQGTLFWIKLVSGKIPEILGKSSGDRVTYRLSVKTDSKSKVLALSIIKAKLSDTAVYYCVKTEQRNLTFLKGTNLKVGEPVTSTVPQSDTEPSVTLQSLVLHDSQNEKCPEDDSIFCCCPESHQILNFSQWNNGEDKYEKNSKQISSAKYLCSSFKTFNCSDFRMFSCVVATCGKNLSGNKSKFDTEAPKKQDLKDKIIFYLLCASSFLCLIISVFLLFSTEKLRKKSDYSNDETPLLKNASTWGNLKSDGSVYSVAIFTSKKRKQNKAKQ
ncbi:uncharacterized protein KZ484_007937 [Pholidichthys leucotaenia]